MEVLDEIGSITGLCPLQNESGLPEGMVSLLTAPLVADGSLDDSVSWNLALWNI